MGNKKKYFISIAVMLALFVLTYTMLFRQYSIEQCFDIIAEIDLKYFIMAALLVCGYIFFDALNLKVSISSVGKPMSLVTAIKYSLVGIYFSAITPSSSGGQPVQVYYMSREAIPVSQSAIALMFVTVIFKLVLLTLGLPLIFFKTGFVFWDLPHFRVLFSIGVFLNVFMMMLLLFVMFSKKLVYSLLQLVVRVLVKLRIVKNREKFMEKADRQVDKYHKAADIIKARPWLSVKLYFLTACQRAAMFSVAYCIYRAFGMNSLTWLDVMAIQIGLSFSVDSLPLPGAVGISEGVFIGLYRDIYGPAYLVPALVLVRGCTYYLPMIVSGITSGIFHIRLLDREGRKLSLRKGGKAGGGSV